MLVFYRAYFCYEIVITFPVLQKWLHQSNDDLFNMAWASCQIHKIEGCACAGNAGNVFPVTRGLAIPTCITARAWRTCRDACRDRQLAISFEVGGGENVPGIPGACATRNFTYLVRGPCNCLHHAQLHLQVSIMTWDATQFSNHDIENKRYIVHRT